MVIENEDFESEIEEDFAKEDMSILLAAALNQKKKKKAEIKLDIIMWC